MKNKETWKRLKNRRGFTLIELMVVMVILGMLAALVGPKLFKNVEQANVQTTKTQLSMLEQGLDSFRLDTGRYPNTTEGLNALVTNPGVDGWAGPYLAKKNVPLDGWKQPYQYQSPGTHGDYDLYSNGADKAQGGEGYNKDITSWE